MSQSYRELVYHETCPLEQKILSSLHQCELLKLNRVIFGVLFFSFSAFRISSFKFNVTGAPNFKSIIRTVSVMIYLDGGQNAASAQILMMPLCLQQMTWKQKGTQGLNEQTMHSGPSIQYCILLFESRDKKSSLILSTMFQNSIALGQSFIVYDFGCKEAR